MDFTSLIMAGDKSGLSCLGLTSQRQFLQNLGLCHLLRALSGCGLGYHYYLTNRMAMQDLVRPGGPGSFKVLIQSKGVTAPQLWGLKPKSEVLIKLAAVGTELPLLPQPGGELPAFGPGPGQMVRLETWGASRHVILEASLRGKGPGKTPGPFSARQS